MTDARADETGVARRAAAVIAAAAAEDLSERICHE
jgi:hypothetical protein